MSVSGCGCYCNAAIVDISSDFTVKRDGYSRICIEGSEARKWIFRNRFLLQCDYEKKSKNPEPRTGKGLQTARVMYWHPILSIPG